MNSRLFAIISIIILSSASIVVMSDDASAEWVDPNYRDPPAADYVINLTDDLSFKSNDPAYSIKWDVGSASGTDNSDDARLFTFLIGTAVYDESSLFWNHGYKYTKDQVLPSWIVWNASLKGSDPESAYFELTIMPALQQVSEDTHGRYWIWTEITYPSGLGDKTESFLIQFEVDVAWDGGVIVPDEYVTFTLNLDYGIAGGSNNKTFRQVLPVGTEEYRFPVKDLAVSREGYTFGGWSQTSGSSASDVGDEYPMNINNASVTSKVVDGRTVYTATLYAVWNPVAPDELELPDLLQDTLDLLSDPYVMILFFVIVFGAAFIVRSRKVGGI